MHSIHDGCGLLRQMSLDRSVVCVSVCWQQKLVTADHFLYVQCSRPTYANNRNPANTPSPAALNFSLCLIVFQLHTEKVHRKTEKNKYTTKASTLTLRHRLTISACPFVLSLYQLKLLSLRCQI